MLENYEENPGTGKTGIQEPVSLLPGHISTICSTQIIYLIRQLLDPTSRVQSLLVLNPAVHLLYLNLLPNLGIVNLLLKNILAKCVLFLHCEKLVLKIYSLQDFTTVRTRRRFLVTLFYNLQIW